MKSYKSFLGSERQLDAKEPDPIVATVINKLSTRSQDGMRKYGQTILACDYPTTRWIDEVIEEMLDSVVYLERLKRKLNDDNIS